MLLTLRIAPGRCRRSSGMSRWQSLVSARMLTWIIRSIFDHSLVSNDPESPNPALLIKKSSSTAFSHQRVAERIHLRGHGEIDRVELHAQGRVDLEQFVTQRFEPVRAPGHQDQGAGQRRELAGDFAANAGGSTRNERRAFEKIFHESG